MGVVFGMRLFVRQILSAASLIVLLPTVILIPYAAFGFLIALAGLFKSGGGFAPSLLMLVWISGYFTIGITYLALLTPLPRMAGFILWALPASYLLLMFIYQPWNAFWPMAGGSSSGNGFATWAMTSLSILFPISLIGFWLERPRAEKLPPPYPG